MVEYAPATGRNVLISERLEGFVRDGSAEPVRLLLFVRDPLPAFVDLAHKTRRRLNPLVVGNVDNGIGALEVLEQEGRLDWQHVSSGLCFGGGRHVLLEHDLNWVPIVGHERDGRLLRLLKYGYVVGAAEPA